MTLAELRDAAKEFDQEFIAEKARPMSVAESARNRELRRVRPSEYEDTEKIKSRR
jgi:hypothetical protein